MNEKLRSVQAPACSAFLNESECVRLFVEGFFRFSKVIFVNGNFDHFLESKFKSRIYENFDKLLGHKERYDYLRQQLLLDLNTHQAQGYVLKDGVKVYSYAKTKNNIRELSYLEQQLKKVDDGISFLNLAEVDRFVDDSRYLKIISSIEKSIEIIFKREFEVSKSLLFQSRLYLKAFLDFWSTFSADRSGTVRFVAVANDHSPVQVAFIMISRLFGCRTIYIQHAEITESFPELNFDYSILKNLRSKSIYRKIAPVKGMMQVSGDESNCIDVEELMSSFNEILVSKSKDVVIYGSSLVSERMITIACSRLRANPQVNKIYYKPHPRIAAEELNFLKGIDTHLLSESPKFDHLAICGNSSVCLEVASEGFPVFLCYEIDSLPEDYYGFVRSGLFNGVGLDDLDGAFWRESSFDIRFVQNLSEFNPRISTIANQKETSSWFYFLRMLSFDIFEKYGLLLQEKRKLLLRNSLVFWPTSFVRSCEISNIPRIYKGVEIIKLLDSLFNDRDPLFMRALYGMDCADCNNIIQFWAQMKRVEFSGYTLSRPEVEGIDRYIASNRFGDQSGRWHEARYLSYLVRIGDVIRLENFLKNLKFLKIYSLPISQKIAVFRLLLDKKSTMLEDVKSDLYRNESDFHKLKIDVQCGVFHDLDYRSISERFVKLAPPEISKEYSYLFDGLFPKLSSDNDFIDIRVSQEVKDRFERLISYQLQNLLPFAMIRLSDGEGYIFGGSGRIFTEYDAQNRERHWWGQQVGQSLAEEIRGELLQAVKSADMLGVPTIYRFIRDHNDKSRSLRQNLQGRGLVQVLQWITENFDSNKAYTDDKVNLSVFLDVEFLLRVGALANKVIIVTSATEDAISNALEGRLDFQHIMLPTHFKTVSNSKYSSIGRPLPFVYKDVIKKLDSHVEPGDLVLVAGGLVGKLFISYSKYKGAVALDMGSAMDDLIGAGVHSLH